jgi:hypothetical protein
VSVFRYAIREIFFRRGRSLVTTTSVALAVLAAVLLTALATSYSRAIRKPIETVGADVIVQMTGDIPLKLEGLVFPHPNALLPAAQVAEIRAIPGVVSLTRAVADGPGPRQRDDAADGHARPRCCRQSRQADRNEGWKDSP